MAYFKVHCFNCGNTYDIYREEVANKKKARCPHCYATMNERQFDKLENAFFTLEEVNGGLRKRAVEYGDKLFQVEYVEHYVPHEKMNIGDYE